jgi:Icc-related predicted phosphoesterase
VTNGGEGLRIAAIGDLHVKEDSSEILRTLLSEVCASADALVLCGDLTDMGKKSEAEVLRDGLRACAIPTVAVLGNHDYECGAIDDVRTLLKEARVHLLEGESVEIKGVGFAGVKGFLGGFGRRMLGSFGEPAIKAIVSESITESVRLENALHAITSERIVVVLHYAPIAETVEGEPEEIYPFLGSSRLAETIDRFRVNAVFHGHAHRGKFEGKTPGGAPVYNVAWPIRKPGGKDFALVTV